jgi:hypothetical protein
MQSVRSEVHEGRVRVDPLADAVQDALDDTVAARAHGVLHFHAFEHDERVALLTRWPACSVHRDDASRHRRARVRLFFVGRWLHGEGSTLRELVARLAGAHEHVSAVRMHVQAPGRAVDVERQLVGVFLRSHVVTARPDLGWL